MRIGIVCLPERGGYYATFALAKSLALKGHEIVYFGPIDFRADVTAQGFAYVTVLQQVFGKDESDPPPVPESWWRRMAISAKLAREYAGHPGRWKLFDVLVDRYLAGVIRSHALDLTLVDALFQEVIPELAASGVPTRIFATELSSGLRCVPPSSSWVIPCPGVLGKLLIRIAWWRCFTVHCWNAAKQLLTVLVLRLLTLGAEIAPPRVLMRRVRRVRQEDMERSGLRGAFWEYGGSGIVPDVFLCSAEFDFPDARKSRLYLGPCIELDRTEVDFPWREIDGSRKLLYISLGTHAGRYRGRTLPFLQTIVEVAAAMPALQFVVVLGKGRRAATLGTLPENLIAVQFGPQLALLERAAVAVTNGGLGTIKECLWFGVPMIVLPCRWDQPGNAARVVFHRLGLRARIDHLRASRLRALIEECLHSEEIREGVAFMRERLRSDSAEMGARIDSLLEERPTGVEFVP